MIRDTALWLDHTNFEMWPEPVTSDFETEEPDDDNTIGDAVLAMEKIRQTAAQLRDLAQQGGWSQIYIEYPDKIRDLCSRCFSLPPEG